MVQAAVLDGLVFDASPFGPNGFATPEVDVSRGQVVQAFMVALVIIVIDECLNICLKRARHVVVFQQDAVLHGLVPALDLTLRLGMGWRAADMLDALC